MADTGSPDYAERARMHDRLAGSTEDPAARQMHQAMAAEFRRRAREAAGDDLPPAPVQRPIMELAPPL